LSEILRSTTHVRRAVFEDIGSIAERARQEAQRRQAAEDEAAARAEALAASWPEGAAPGDPDALAAIEEQPDLVEARAQADALVTEARVQAQEILEGAQRQFRATAEQAHQEGYRAGFTEGYSAATEACEMQSATERTQFRTDVEHLVELIEAERRRLWTQAEHQVVSFTLELARKVVKDDAQINHEIAISVVRNALRRVVETDRIRIRVNAADLSTVRSCREDLLTLVDGINLLEVVEDRRVGPGGCVVETNEDIEQGKYVIFAFQLGSQFVQGVQGRLVRLRKLNGAAEETMGKDTFEGIISFNNVSSDHEKVIVDYVLNAQKQFEQNLGISTEG